MAGNSKRQGAIRKPGVKKGATVGSGGNRRQGLEGKGPTPKATERPGHKAKRHADHVAAEREKQAPARGGKPAGSASLGRRPRRGPRDTEVVAGRNPVVEALAARVPAIALHVQRFIDADPRIKQAMAQALELGIPIREDSRGELDRLTDGVVHQGIALDVAPYEYADLGDLLVQGTAARPSLLVALDGVTDPRNMGAIARSTAAFGGTGLVIPARRSATVTATAWRASAGALAHVPVAQVTNLTRSLEAAQKAGFTVVGLAGDADVDIRDADLGNAPVMLVVGGEGNGLGRLVAQTCDIRAAIGIDARVESLNAAVAAGIALHSVVSARR